MSDQAADAESCLQRDERQLGRFAGARFAADHHDLVLFDRLSNFISAFKNGQLLVEFQFRSLSEIADIPSKRTVSACFITWNWKVDNISGSVATLGEFVDVLVNVTDFRFTGRFSDVSHFYYAPAIYFPLAIVCVWIVLFV